MGTVKIQCCENHAYIKMLKKRITNLIDNDSLANGKIAKVKNSKMVGCCYNGSILDSMVLFGYYVTLSLGGGGSRVCSPTF